MKEYIALLRGVNVGGKNKLPMKELVDILESLGYQDVRTYIQSGNVVFSSHTKVGKSQSDEISRAILSKMGFAPKVLLLDRERFQRSIEHNPFPVDNGKVLHFFFFDAAPPKPDIDRLEQLRAGTEKFELAENLMYLYAPDGIGRSKLAASVEKAVGVSVTARNWNTVEKLRSMLT